MLTLEAARRVSHCYEPQWGGHQYGRPKPRGKLVAQRYLLVSHGPSYSVCWGGSENAKIFCVVVCNSTRAFIYQTLHVPSDLPACELARTARQPWR